VYIWSYEFGWKATIQTAYDIFNGDTFLSFLKEIHAKFPKCYLFMDKASPHTTDQRRYKSILKKTRTLLSQYIFQLHHHRVYGDGKSVEYSQA